MYFFKLDVNWSFCVFSLNKKPLLLAQPFKVFVFVFMSLIFKSLLNRCFNGLFYIWIMMFIIWIKARNKTIYIKALFIFCSWFLFIGFIGSGFNFSVNLDLIFRSVKIIVRSKIKALYWSAVKL